jgi:2-polyprenyl-3-methyl-5-hydroxy-6-metoxy-1,4-benzoquinol methylase
VDAERLARFREVIYSSYGRDWQDAGEYFDPAAAARWGRAYGWYLRGWLPARRDAAIADLACGQGRLLYWLKSRGYTNLYGVDIAPDQVALARQVATVDQEDLLSWLAERPERFDLLIGLDIIEHFARDEALRFLELAYAALKTRRPARAPDAERGQPVRHASALRRHHPRVGLQCEPAHAPAPPGRVRGDRSA